MLSIPHLIIVFIVALVVFGPEKLPELARNVGKVLAEFKRASGDFRSTFEDHLRELEREADERKIMKTADSAAPAGAVPATPTYVSATAVEESGEQAPWEKAVETAAAGAEISAEPPVAAEEIPAPSEDMPPHSEHNQETPIDGNFTT